MNISPEIFRRLEIARELQNDYQSNEQTRRGLGKISLNSTIGITCAGKTTVAENAQKIAPDMINPVITTTTRPPKPGEALDAMHFVPHDDEHLEMILDDIERGELAQYVIHPTGYIYGTYLRDYQEGMHNIMPTVASTIDYLSTLPYGEFRKIVVVPDIDAWRRTFKAAAYPPDQAIKRLEEGEESLLWALQHKSEIQWLHNREGKQQEVARQFLELLNNPSQSNQDAIAIAARLLEAGVRPLLSRARGF